MDHELHIEISYRDIPKTDAIEAHIREHVGHTLGRFADRVSRVEIHIGDHNSEKSGPNDKRCLIEARPKGLDPVVVEAEGSDLYAVVSDAASKMRRVLDKRFEKLSSH